jgi:hypothetical protein
LQISLKAGTALSYSAGRTDLNPYRFRVVGSGDTQFNRILIAFPELNAYVRAAPPVIINAYPATLGQLPFGIFIDSYLRQENLSRALLFAEAEQVPAIILAQPLPVIEFLTRHIQLSLPLPRSVVFFVGGYAMPASAEAYLLRLCSKVASTASVYHAYGDAEVDFAILVGKRDRVNVLFKQVHPSVIVSSDSGKLTLAKSEHVLDNDKSGVRTEDSVEITDEGIRIVSGYARLAPDVSLLLESWSDDDWRRRTGYLHRASEGAYIIQLRVDELPVDPNELDYFEFCRRFRSGWTEKPKWGGDGCDPKKWI